MFHKVISATAAKRDVSLKNGNHESTTPIHPALRSLLAEGAGVLQRSISEHISSPKSSNGSTPIGSRNSPDSDLSSSSPNPPPIRQPIPPPRFVTDLEREEPDIIVSETPISDSSSVSVCDFELYFIALAMICVNIFNFRSVVARS